MFFFKLNTWIKKNLVRSPLDQRIKSTLLGFEPDKIGNDSKIFKNNEKQNLAPVSNKFLSAFLPEINILFKPLGFYSSSILGKKRTWFDTHKRRIFFSFEQILNKSIKQ